jgi:hypothetical protein
MAGENVEVRKWAILGVSGFGMSAKIVERLM